MIQALAASPDPAPGLLSVPDVGALSGRDFERLSGFIHGLVGIKLPPSKLSMVEGRLRRRVAATGAASFAAYCSMVFQQGEEGRECVHLINAITTNKTDFFREPEHFRLLRETVLPDVCDAGRAPKLWSAACSTGAEPYTLAMVIADYQGAHGQIRPGLTQGGAGRGEPPPSALARSVPHACIIATDISTQVLETARLGIYPAEMVEPVPPALQKRYLLRARDPGAGTVRIIPALRAQVRFGRLNLMSPSYEIDHDLDAIFCRNVLIYFDREGQAAVLRRLCDHLRPGGALVLGHSESLSGLDLPVRALGHTFFQRI